MTMPSAVDMPGAEVASEHDSDGSARLVLDHLGLARKLAARYAGRGEPMDELVQVAMLGLVQAANRFDPERGSHFASFAVPTILGEIRRHFRDYCWAVHIPRPLHDLYHAVLRANERLSAELKRPPTVRELATELDVRDEEIIKAQESGSAYSATSLDSPASDSSDGESRSLAELIGAEDEALVQVEERETVRRILAEVPPRERHILVLWFFGEHTQRQIAEELEMSQMHVSRLIASTLSLIRAAVFDPSGQPIQWPTQRQRRKAS
ncbi:SigB/SigF/SigG family RNA polymerase sigma factor [Actinopolymorpha alba]|uniref:SigB/SigF/SigG family RNA polymerase sigma factor n=1 Tax=Actinopolymorpha alba TaxID=533267 RepID=UPI0012F65769|nr:SigB/SigF/SigG family RNA polymerase sigma factor [Actinopolymorpha alba]